MNQMLDGNTAALNSYLFEQEQLERRAAIEADDLRTEMDEKVIDEIRSNSELALEAIGTEATLIAINKLNPELVTLFVDAIECRGTKSEDEAFRILGEFVTKLTYCKIGGERLED